MSRAATEPQVEPFDPRAKRTVGGAFLAMFTVFGVAYSFGVFFDPMAAELGASRSATSAVFSITAFAYFSLGMVSGRLVDRVGPRKVLVAGAMAMGIGLALTSRVEAMWMGYITYGAGVGIGVACGYVPMVAVVGGWFDRGRAFALGVAVAGIGLGTLVVPPIGAALVDAHGWRTTYVIFATGSALAMLLAATITSPPPVMALGDPPSLSASVRTPAFACLYASGLLMSLAMFQVFVYLVPFAEDEGVQRVPAAALVGIVGGASIVGRLGLGFVAERMGRVRVYRACFFVMAASFGLWLLADGYPALVSFAVIFGVGYGGFIALSPAVVAELFGPTGMGSVVGTLYTSAAIGGLFGPPLAGAVIDAAGYPTAITASMVIALAAWAVLIPLGRNGTEVRRPS